MNTKPTPREIVLALNLARQEHGQLMQDAICCPDNAWEASIGKISELTDTILSLRAALNEDLGEEEEE